MDMGINILCVCTHNYFRSQITAHLLRARGYQNVRSAGTATTYIGVRAHHLVMDAIAKSGGTSTTYQARQLTEDDIAWADVILCAEQEHADFIKNMNYPFHTYSIVVMGVPDGGVDNPQAVAQVTRQIVEFLDKWN